MKDTVPRVIKPEPDWGVYKSSFDQIGASHPNPNGPVVQQGPVFSQSSIAPQVPVVSAFDQLKDSGASPKKRGRKKKVKEEPKELNNSVQIKQETITDTVKVKKKRDRFHGLTEEEVLKKVLPDHLAPDLDILIIGINPGLTAAYVGHHYAGPGNHFWKCLFLSGLIPEQMNAYDDNKLLQYGIGFTNIVERTSRGSADLSKKEIQEGGQILRGKVQKYKPKIAVFNGKGIYEVFVGHKKFSIGKQPDPFPDCSETAVFVMPSSSARFTQLPRAIDKVPFYLALKKFRDHLKGNLKELSEEEICFPDLDLKVVPKVERLAKEKALAESNGQVWPVKQECDGETKPKRSRKKKMADKAPETCGFTVVNEPAATAVKQEPAATVSASTSATQSNLPAEPPSAAPNVEQMLSDGGSLVKQEDLSELKQFGINPFHLQQAFSTTAHMAAQSYNPAITSSMYWPPMCSGNTAMFSVQPHVPNMSQATAHRGMQHPATYSGGYQSATPLATSVPSQNSAGTMSSQFPGNASTMSSQFPVNASTMSSQFPVNASTMSSQFPVNASTMSSQFPVTSHNPQDLRAQNQSIYKTHPYWSQFPDTPQDLSKK